MTNQSNATINLSDTDTDTDTDHVDPHAKALPFRDFPEWAADDARREADQAPVENTAARLEDAARAGFDVADDQADVLTSALAASVDRGIEPEDIRAGSCTLTESPL